MLSRFPTFRRPLPLGRHETAASLLARHAAQLGVPGAAVICTDLGVPWSSIMSGEAECLRDLANAAGVSHDALLAWSPVRTPDGARIGQEPLANTILSQRFARVCPLCLRDDLAGSPNHPALAAFGRVHWLIACLSVCEIHSVVLIEPNVGQPDQTRSDFARWVQPVLRDLDAMIRKAVPSTPSACDTYLFARLRGEAQSSPLLDGLALPDVTQACEVLGQDLHVGKGGTTTVNDVVAMQVARGRGFGLLAAGPAELTRSFDDRLAKIGADNLAGLPLTNVYGRFYRWLGGRSQACLDPIRDVIADHAFANLPLPAGTSVCGRVLPARRRHTIRTAVAEFHSRAAAMRTWLTAEDIMVDVLSETDDTTLIPETPAATAFLDTARNAFTHRQASRFLKINSDRLDELISERIVRPRFSTIADPTRNAYARTELADLLNRLISGRPIGVPADQTDIAYARVTQIAVQAHCTFPDVVRLLLAKPRIRTFRRRNETGLRALHVSVEDVVTAIHRATLPGLTPWRFTQTLHITRRDLEQLIDLGLIWTKPVRHPVLQAPIAVIPKACITAFQRRYISLEAFADRRERHWIAQRKLLNAYGIEPIYDGPSPRSRFYETAAVKHMMRW